MKKIKLIYPILLFITLSLNSCSKKCGGNIVGPDGKIFTFRLIDSNTNESVIAAWGAKYDNEDVFFEQKSNDSIRGLKIGENGRFSFYLINDISSDNRADIVDKPFTNIYYLHLNNENIKTDIDTLMISSEVESIENECLSIGFGATTIIFNDSIYHNGKFIQHIDFIKKN